MEILTSFLELADTDPWIFWPVVIFFGLIIYFMPTTIIKPAHKGWMFWLNLFIGWTGGGWGVLLFIGMFLMESDEEKKERERAESQEKLDEETKKSIEAEREEFIRLANKEAEDKLLKLKAGVK